MSKPNIQIGDEVREMTQAEFDLWQADSERLASFFERQAATVNALAAAKVSARTKLAALGLTDAEIAALVGQ